MGRPVENLIDRTEVIKTALAMIDEHGPDGLNMRSLGAQLGVNPASLYYHFRDKDEILDAVADYLVRSTKISRAKRIDTWEQAAIELAWAYRSVIVAHPNAAVMVAARRSRYRPAPAHPHYEDFLSRLTAEGFSMERALMALVALECLASGSALEEACMGPDVRFEPVDSQRHPTLYATTESVKLNVRDRFREMCHLLLVGLRAEQPKGAAKKLPGRTPVKKRSPKAPA